MKRIIAIFVLVVLAPIAARADDDLGPLALRLSNTSIREGVLRRARAEKSAGAALLTLSVMTSIASIAIMASASSCANSPDSDCGLGLVLPLIATSITAIITGIVGTAFVVTGSIRQSDALHLAVAPTVNAHGAGLGLSLNF